MEFSKDTKEKLGFYVYSLVDPRSNEIFYVGKASANNRAFDHLKIGISSSKKKLRIEEIRKAGDEPKIDILRYGLPSEEVAFEVEAAIIDSIGIENLTNEVRGHGIERGRILAQSVERLYGSRPFAASEITHRCMAFFITNSYSPTMTEQQVYDCTRQFWHGVSEKTRNDKSINIALSVVEGVVVQVYSIEAWFAAGATLSSRKYSGNKNDRWEFVGNIVAGHELLGCLLTSDDGSKLPATQKGYMYFPRRT